MDFQQTLVWDGQRQGTDGHRLLKHLFACDAVSSGSSLNQQSIAIGQIQSQAIKFVFHRIGQWLQTRCARMQLFNAGEPGIQLIQALYFVHAP